jgi:hypothetical protein
MLCTLARTGKTLLEVQDFELALDKLAEAEQAMPRAYEEIGLSTVWPAQRLILEYLRRHGSATDTMLRRLVVSDLRPKEFEEAVEGLGKLRHSGAADSGTKIEYGRRIRGVEGDDGTSGGHQERPVSIRALLKQTRSRTVSQRRSTDEEDKGCRGGAAGVCCDGAQQRLPGKRLVVKSVS